MSRHTQGYRRHRYPALCALVIDPGMRGNLSYILIHSPLVGPFTWQSVQSELEKRGFEALTPTLRDDPDDARLFWQQHATSVVESMNQIPHHRKLILVGHSGAGPLLPGIRQLLSRPVAAYVFVDAGIPHDSSSRLDLMRLQNPQWAEQFHQALLRGERFPTWNETDLWEIIPDAGLRQKLIAELHPRAHPFFAEPIPVSADWPDAPCAYIKFSAAYDWDYGEARKARWLLRELHAGHFHMLVNPLEVTDLLIDVVHELGNRHLQAGP